MGFSFRKTFRLGKGLNINLSKRGLGFSTGIKGFRIGMGGGRKPRINIGRGMFRFQKSLGSDPAPDSGGCGCGGCLGILLVAGVVVGGLMALGSMAGRNAGTAAQTNPVESLPETKPPGPAAELKAATPPPPPPPPILRAGGKAIVVSQAQFIFADGVWKIPADTVLQIESISNNEAVVIYQGVQGRVVLLRLKPIE